MKNKSFQIINDLYKKMGGCDLTCSYSNCTVFILNKITGNEQYSKGNDWSRVSILKNNQKHWEHNSDNDLHDELVNYIKNEILLFKLEILNED